MTKFLNASIGVTGASGHLGRRVVDLLLEAGAKHVVALTRDPAKLADLSARGVDIRKASFDDPAGLTSALAGVERLLIISTDAVDGAGTRARQQTAAVDAAVAAGVKHLAYTSITSPYPDPGSPIADSHFWTEARVFQSPGTWSVLRNNLYTDYLVPGAQQAIASGTAFHAAENGRRAYVTREDCAVAAVAALLGAEGRRIFDIDGPDALSVGDLAALYARLSGRPVAAQSIPSAALVSGLVGAGVPEGMANVLARFDVDAAKGYLGVVSGHFAELTGRAPESVEAFLTRNRTALAA